MAKQTAPGRLISSLASNSNEVSNRAPQEIRDHLEYQRDRVKTESFDTSTLKSAPSTPGPCPTPPQTPTYNPDSATADQWKRVSRSKRRPNKHYRDTKGNASRRLFTQVPPTSPSRIKRTEKYWMKNNAPGEDLNSLNKQIQEMEINSEIPTGPATKVALRQKIYDHKVTKQERIIRDLREKNKRLQTKLTAAGRKRPRDDTMKPEGGEIFDLLDQVMDHKEILITGYFGFSVVQYIYKYRQRRRQEIQDARDLSAESLSESFDQFAEEWADDQAGLVVIADTPKLTWFTRTKLTLHRKALEARAIDLGALEMDFQHALSKIEDKKFDVYSMCIKVLSYCVGLQNATCMKDIIYTTIAVAGQHLDVNCITLLFGEHTEETVPQGMLDDFQTKITNFRKSFLTIEEVPFFDIIKKGFILTMFCGLKPKCLDSSPEIVKSLLDKFPSSVPKDFGAMKIIDSILAIGDFVVSSVKCLVAGESLRKFIMPCSLHERYADITAKYDKVKNGTFDTKADGTLDKFCTEIQELENEVKSSIAGKSLTGHLKVVYTQYSVNLQIYKQTVEHRQRNADYRIRPYGLFLFGKSQIGKSFISSLLVSLFRAVRGEEISAEEIYYWSEVAKFQTGYDNNKKILVLDDVDTIKHDENREKMIAVIINSINNMPSMINQAELSQKGNNFERILMMLITSNKELGGIEEVFDYAPAASNRLHFNEVILMKEYADEHGRIVKEKLEYEDGISKPHHYIQRYRLHHRFQDANDPNRCTSTVRVDVGKPIPIVQWLKETAIDMKKYYENQEQFVKDLKRVRNIDCCKKCFMIKNKGYCSCIDPAPQVAPESLEFALGWFEDDTTAGKALAWLGLRGDSIIEWHFYGVEMIIFKVTCAFIALMIRSWAAASISSWPYLLIFMVSLVFVYEKRYEIEPTAWLWIFALCVAWIILYMKAVMRVYRAHIRRKISQTVVRQGVFTAGVLGVSSLLIAGTAIRTISNLLTGGVVPEGNLIPTSEEECEERQAEKNEWLTPARSPIPKPITLATMTMQQVINKVKNNLVRVEFQNEHGRPKGRGMALLVDGQHLLLPNHFAEGFDEFSPNGSILIRRAKDTRNQALTFLVNGVQLMNSEGKLKDFKLYTTTKAFSVQSILKFLPTEGLPEDVCEMITYSQELTFVQQQVRYSPRDSVTNGESHRKTKIYDRGSQHSLPLGSKAGDCLSPLIRRTKPHFITSFHSGGKDKVFSDREGVSFDLLRGEVETALKQSHVMEYAPESEIVIPTAVLEEVDTTDFQGNDMVHLGDYHERSNIRFIAPMDETDLPSVDGFGENARSRHQSFSSVSNTRLSQHLEEHGNINKWGKPRFRTNRNHAEYLQIGIRPMKDIDPWLLNVAQRDYLSVLPQIQSRLNWKDKSPISIDQAINGIRGRKFIHALDPDTAAGPGYNGKKSKHLEITYSDVTGRRNMVPKDYLIENINGMIHKHSQGMLCSPIVRTALKDAPTLFAVHSNGKDKVRIFAVQPMDFLIEGKMIFAPILEFIQLNPLEFEMLQGINVTTDEWEQVAAHILDFEPTQVLEGDFSKMDVRLSGQIIRAAGSVLIAIAREIGYESQDLRIMESYICDLATTIWDFNGLMMLLDGWNTSGNYLTIVLNGIALALLHRVAFYKNMYALHCTTVVPPHVFREYNRFGFVGDDSLGSSKLGWYNMQYLQEYFASIGMKYTGGDKSDDVPKFIHASDASLCKRRFYYQQFVGRRVSPLELDSIYKSLHCQMASETDETTRTVQNVDLAFRELARHPPEVFESEKNRILRAANELNIVHLLRHANTSYEDWWLPGLLGDDTIELETPSAILDPIPESELLEVTYFEDLTVVTPPASGVAVEAQLNSDSSYGNVQPMVRLCSRWIRTILLLLLLGTRVCRFKPITRANKFMNQELQNQQQQEVIDFGSQQAHWVAGMDVQDEQTTTEAQTYDTNDGFLERPVKISTFQWNIGTELNFTIDPWSAFFNDARVAARTAHFKNLRCGLTVRFMLNGNPFYYGRLLCSYQPLPEVDGITEFRVTEQTDYIEASQRLHVLLDPTLSQGGDMELPFIYPKNYLSIPEKEWVKMGRITVGSLNPLLHANASTKPITVTVLAYAHNVDLSTPTIRTSAEITPQSEILGDDDEYGIVSGPAHTIANISGKLADVPVIGPFARATNMASSAIGGIASLFGFSRPRQVNEANVNIVRYAGNSACTNVMDTSTSLALDSKKEVTIDPRVTNASTTDEMALVPIAMRESYVTQFQWKKTDPVDDPLFQMRVGPIAGDKDSEGNIHMTPSAFVSVPFSYWTGSMEYRLQVVCSSLHRGRIRVVWDPEFFNSESGATFNTNYSKIIDISECTDLSFKIGWGQDTNYLKVSELGKLPNFDRGVTIPVEKGYNGHLSIFVVNSLTSPSDDTNPVYINVYSKACEDFELAGPTEIQIREFTPKVRATVPVDPIPSSKIFQGSPAYTLFRVTMGSLDPMLSSLPSQEPQYEFFSGNSIMDLLYFNPVAGTATAVIDVKNNGPDNNIIEFRNIARDFSYSGEILFPLTGDTQSIVLTIPNVPQGVNYIPIELNGLFGNFVITGVRTRIPETWNSKIVLPQTTQINSDIELVGNFEFNRSLASFPLGTLALPTNLGWFDNAVIGSRFTLPLLDGGNINGTVWENLSGGEWTPTTMSQTWGLVEPARVVELTDPVNSGVDPWVPIWGPLYFFEEDPIVPQSEFVPESEIISEDRAEDTVEPNAPVSEERVTAQMGPSVVSSANQVYFGEQAGSIRQLLKRYTTEVTINALARQFYVDLAQYPTLNEDTDVNGIEQIVNNGNPFDWFVPAFICVRGSMRIKLFSSYADGSAIRAIVANRVAADDSVSSPEIGLENRPGHKLTWSGGCFSFLSTLGVLEVEMPWYSQYRFTPARSFTPRDENNFVERDWLRIKTSCINNTDLQIAYAAGEDFSLMNFLSTPIVRPI